MELIREIIVPTQNTYTLQLPDEMIGKQIEVIAFEIDKKIVPKDDNKPLPNELADIQKIFEGKRVDLSNFKFNREEANNYDE